MFQNFPSYLFIILLHLNFKKCWKGAISSVFMNEKTQRLRC